MMADEKVRDLELARGAVSGAGLRDLVLDLWQRTRIDWSFATDHLSRAFRSRRDLGSDERRFVAETLYGMIRNLRRIDEALAAGGHARGVRAPDGLRLIAYFVLELGLSVDDALRSDVAGAAAIDWRAVAAIDDRLAGERDAVRRIARLRSLPDHLAARLVRDLGAGEADALAAALNQRAPMTIRANTLVNSRDQLAAALADEGIETEPGRYADQALRVTTRTNLFGLRPFERGGFEAQDEGSQLIAELVAPPPRSRVVDYCAGAGGKTLALAALLGNRGRVVACDVAKGKLNELRRRARRATVTNVQVVRLDDRGWAPPLARIEGTAPRVLVDAPCTGIGSLRRNPEARWRLTEDDLDRLPRLQYEIASRALALVEPGGRLIYATCTLLADENRGVVDRLLAAHSDLSLMPAKEIWGREKAAAITDDSGTFLEVSPSRHGTDGFFAAVLRRQK
jgi:16S rRNA (cytosine967-C5)-methyltransferase